MSRTIKNSAERLSTAEREFGGGDTWRTALETSLDPRAVALITDHSLIPGDEFGIFRYSLVDLCQIVNNISANYLAKGIKPRDRVAVYIDESFEYQLHLGALSQIGAIAVLLNGSLAAETALVLLRRSEPVALVSDFHHISQLDLLERRAVPYWTKESLLITDAADQPRRRFQHADDDPVLLCHTSGTTGTPKLVIWTHRQSVEGARFRLRNHQDSDDTELLSAVPQSHSGATAFTFHSILAGVPLVVLSNRTAANVARYTRQTHATTIMAFSSVFADIATTEPHKDDYSTIRYWLNTGDSAHDAHVRKLLTLGHRLTDDGPIAGTVFGDSLGASEMGWAPLRRVITPETAVTPRHVGSASGIGEVRVMSEDGEFIYDGGVGLLAVKGPSISPGYWNDSDALYKSSLRGYRLTGDLVQEVNGEFFHLDRLVDSFPVDDAGGTPGYSVLMEEIILLAMPQLLDCAVVIGNLDGSDVPVAVVRTTVGFSDLSAALEGVNQALQAADQPHLGMLERESDRFKIPVGPTGKVLKRELRRRYRVVKSSDAWRGECAFINQGQSA